MYTDIKQKKIIQIFDNDNDNDDVTENEQASSFKNSSMLHESNRLDKECLPTQHGIRVEKNQPQTTQVFKKIQTKNDNLIQRKQVLSNDVTKKHL